MVTVSLLGRFLNGMYIEKISPYQDHFEIKQLITQQNDHYLEAQSCWQAYCIKYNSMRFPQNVRAKTLKLDFWLTEKKASSKTSRGPENPTTRRGWAPIREKSTPCIAVAMMSSDTPIRPSVFSPRIRIRKQMSLEMRDNLYGDILCGVHILCSFSAAVKNNCLEIHLMESMSTKRCMVSIKNVKLFD